MTNSAAKISSFSVWALTMLGLSLTGCQKRVETHHEEEHKVIVTSPVRKDVTLTQQYVCQIHSSRHIDICALENGYLEAIPVKEGQAVKEGDVMFRILPTLYKARLDAEEAEVSLAEIEFNNTERLYKQNVVSQPEVALAQAKLAKAQAKLALARAELNFATIKAPFDGIIDKQFHQQGSLIAEGDQLSTLSDNSVMWVYFNVPEARYLEYIANKDKDNLKVELMLANGSIFPSEGKIGAIEADFNNETGNIAFRADFSNPDRVLRHGQTGTILLSRVVKDALVIPQRATFEILAKKYAYVVGKEAVTPESEGEGHEAHEDHSGHHSEHESKHVDVHEAKLEGEHPANLDAEHEAGHEAGHNLHKEVARQREIEIQSELDDIYLIKGGLTVDDKIILEGVRQVRDGESVEYEYLDPAKALDNLKYHAE